MSIFENIKMALLSILDNKLRSFLTMISIIIGIGAVIGIVSIGRGVTNNLVKDILKTTQGAIFVNYKKNKDQDDQEYYGELSNTKDNVYNSKQIDALNELPTIKEVQLLNSDPSANISYLGTEIKEQSLSTLYNEQTFNVDNMIIGGRMFNEYDFKNGQTNILLPLDTAVKLFKNKENALNKDIIINSKIFTVVGVYKAKPAANALLGSMSSKTLYIPFNTWISYTGKQETQNILVIPNPEYSLYDVGQNILKTLEKNKTNTGVYSLIDIDSQIKQITNILNTMTLFVSIVAGISLLVGGIGVMNIMYVSVVERTSEIGLRKAIGASSNQILIQFIIESITVTSIGGLIGLALGLMVNYLGSIIVNYPFTIYNDVIIIGIAFSMLIGLIFGTLPALKAAKMAPIDALRSL